MFYGKSFSIQQSKLSHFIKTVSVTNQFISQWKLKKKTSSENMCVIVVNYIEKILFISAPNVVDILCCKPNRTNYIDLNWNWIHQNGAKELEIMSFNSIYTSCRSISCVRSRSNGLYDGRPSTHDATTTRWSWFSSRLCTLSSRILWTSFVINSIIVVIEVSFLLSFWLLLLLYELSEPFTLHFILSIVWRLLSEVVAYNTVFRIIILVLLLHQNSFLKM